MFPSGGGLAAQHFPVVLFVDDGWILLNRFHGRKYPI